MKPLPICEGNITIIIVTFNSAHCIAALAKGLAAMPHVIVIDNASDDETLSQIDLKLPHAKLIVNSRNLGFGAANNLAANDGYDAFIAGKTTNSQTLAEYAFGATDVGALAPGDRPQVTVSGGNLVLSYQVRVTNPALIVSPQLSTNVPSGFASDPSIATNTVGQITNNGVVLEQRTASVSVDSANPNRKFLRLQVQRGQ